MQAELRRVAVAMVAVGKTRTETAAVGVSRRFVGQWVKAAAHCGEVALAGRGPSAHGLDPWGPGRRPGEQRALTAEQESRLRSLIAEVYSRSVAASLCPVDARCGAGAVRARERCAAGIAGGRPLPAALGVDPATADPVGDGPSTSSGGATRRSGRGWKPSIRRSPRGPRPPFDKLRSGEIQWVDETGLSNPANYGRSFAPAGATPVILRPATRFSLSMIASLTNRGKRRFMIYPGALDTAIFLTLLRRLIRDAPCKVFLIPAFARTDNLKVHHARAVTAWVHKHRDRLELRYLPSYAPEHNPEECLNNDLKQTLARRRTPKTKGALKSSALTSYRRRLQRQPAGVRAFFQAPSLCYAAGYDDICN